LKLSTALPPPEAIFDGRLSDRLRQCVVELEHVAIGVQKINHAQRLLVFVEQEVERLRRQEACHIARFAFGGDPPELMESDPSFSWIEWATEC
jgi:hypothetical protein